ncbi:MAG: hypothetical protein ACREM3_12970 [Candidatus Rokuibacteriota bacterium]
MKPRPGSDRAWPSGVTVDLELNGRRFGGTVRLLRRATILAEAEGRTELVVKTEGRLKGQRHEIVRDLWGQVADARAGTVRVAVAAARAWLAQFGEAPRLRAGPGRPRGDVVNHCASGGVRLAPLLV